MFEEARKRGIPVFMLTSGGYQVCVGKVLIAVKPAVSGHWGMLWCLHNTGCPLNTGSYTIKPALSECWGMLWCLHNTHGVHSIPVPIQSNLY